MRLEKYTLEHREVGQAKRARTLRERTMLPKPIEILAISMESVSDLRGPRKCLHFWGLVTSASRL